jgi:parvulin-like peptidyl-prolyl isomerase
LRRALALVLLAACAEHRPAAPTQADLEGDVVARVGVTSISSALVARVAAARKIPPREALDLLIEDALIASAASKAKLHERLDVQWSLNTAHARFMASRLRDEARAAGPPTDAEVAELTALHWRDYDVPELVRVIHAVVRKPKKDKEALAPDVARALARAVAGAASPEDFEAKARGVDSHGLEIVVERLAPFAADGRVAESESRVDEKFAAAAAALKTPGATSDLVETEFGRHVIRLVERIPPKQMPLEERRAALTEETYAVRARRARDAIIARQAARLTPEISPVAAGLLDHLTGRAP